MDFHERGAFSAGRGPSRDDVDEESAFPVGRSTRFLDAVRLSNRIDLGSVRLLGAVCDAGSIAKAAESESLTPSAISKRIRELEDVFGMPLLVRRREGVVPTAAGRVVAGVWAELEPILRELPDRIASADTRVDGRIKLLCDKRIARFVQLDRLGLARCRQAASRTDMLECVASRLPMALTEIEGDVAVGLAASETAGFVEPPPPGFERYAVVLPRVIFVFRADHPLAGRSSLSAVDVTAHPLVMVGDATGLLAAMRAVRGVAGVEVESAYWARELGAALDHVDTAPCPHIVVAPHVVGERLRRYPSLTWLPCAESWASLRLFVLVRTRGGRRPEVDDLLETAFCIRP